MKELKVLIVDDEIHAQNLLHGFVDGYQSVLKVVQKCADLMSAVEYIKTHPVDVVFLDVEMPVHHGTKIGDFLSREERPAIIYVTAYSNFAIEAIRLGAFDYIVKPIDREALFGCLDRFFEERGQDLLKQQENLVISTHQGQIILDYSDILFLQANGSYTEIYTSETRVIASKPIKYFRQTLTQQFIRVHRSYIVNKKAVGRLVKKENNWWILFNESNHEVPVSRKYKDQIGALV